ncbi:hypothetical protein EJB05_26321, partial [Eragrostis curvula]
MQSIPVKASMSCTFSLKLIKLALLDTSPLPDDSPPAARNSPSPSSSGCPSATERWTPPMYVGSSSRGALASGHDADKHVRQSSRTHTVDVKAPRPRECNGLREEMVDADSRQTFKPQAQAPGEMHLTMVEEKAKSRVQSKKNNIKIQSTGEFGRATASS